jgi:plasmid stabilization system protein ParE
MKIRSTLRAQADLDEIYTYLDAGAPAAAQSVKALIEQRISLLADFPHMAPETDQPGVYELSILRYPYLVYYEINADEVWVLHIRDARRRPWPEDG